VLQPIPSKDHCAEPQYPQHKTTVFDGGKEEEEEQNEHTTQHILYHNNRGEEH